MAGSIGQVDYVGNSPCEVAVFETALQLCTFVWLPLQHWPCALRVPVAFRHELLEWLTQLGLAQQVANGRRIGPLW